MCPAPIRCPAYRRCSLTCPCFLNSLSYTIYCVWTFVHSLCVCVHIRMERSAHTEVWRQQWLSSSITAGYRSACPPPSSSPALVTDAYYCASLNVGLEPPTGILKFAQQPPHPDVHNIPTQELSPGWLTQRLYGKHHKFWCENKCWEIMF